MSSSTILCFGFDRRDETGRLVQLIAIQLVDPFECDVFDRLDVAPYAAPMGLGSLHRRRMSLCLSQDFVGLAQLAVLALQRIVPAMSVGTLASIPRSTSALVAQSCSVCTTQPTVAAIDIAA